MAGIASGSSSSSEDLTSAVVGDQTVDALLQRRKCEIMYELKKLQHGDRPVTGSESRGKVDIFFTKRVQVQESATPVANVDSVEEHRPQQVTIEVQGLLQTRSVSSLLQSDRFRRSLENVVRGHFSAAPQDGRSEGRQSAAAQRSVELAATPEQSHTAQSTRTASLLSVPAPPPSVAGPQSNHSTPTTSNQATTEPQPVSRHEPISAVNQQPASRQEPIRRADPETVMRSWNHDDFVMEISELVHRQLVSNTLTGNFRNRLERHVSRRVAESGNNGLAVQEHILRLPPSHIAHNDFSHLGIQSPQDQQLDDAVSVISATASATIPYAQSNAAVQREMSAMKAQISQLSNMLKMSLDLQLDIQRSIRQEVAAAISQANASSTPGEESSAVSAQLNSRRADDSKCIVCLDDGADAVLYRCGHICMCYSCALRMRSENGKCPVCRAPIADILRAYRISSDS